MSGETDPARELVDLCRRIEGPSDEKGDAFLSRHFVVAPWSREFYEILFCISERIDFVISLVETLEMQEDQRKLITGELAHIKQAFGHSSLLTPWKGRGATFLTREHVAPIDMLSPLVRQNIRYPKLEQDELSEILALADQLLEWLGKHQLVEQDFIRQAIIEGVTKFRFRLERIGWLGWGYAIQSLRDVINAYLILQRAYPQQELEGNPAAMLLKTEGFVKAACEKIKLVAGVVTATDLLLHAYKALMLYHQGRVGIAGLIEHLHK